MSIVILAIILAVVLVIGLPRLKRHRDPQLENFELYFSNNKLFSLSTSQEFINILADHIKGHFYSTSNRLKLIIKIEQNQTRFLIATKPELQESIQHILISLDAEIKLIPVSSNEFKTYKNKYSYRIRVYLTKYFVNPLGQSRTGYDPFYTYSLAALKLKNNESIVTEMVLKPYRSVKINLIKNKLLRAKITAHSYNYQIFSIKRLLIFLLSTLLLVLKALIYLIEIFNRTNPKYDSPALINIRSDREVQILDKLYDSLFKANFSINIITPYKYRLSEITQEIFFSLKSFNTNSKYLNKIVWTHFPNIIRQANNIFSSRELAMFYHIPNVDNPEEIFKISDFKFLALPSILLDDQRLKNIDLSLGDNTNLNRNIKVGLTKQDRERHMYIVGATGSGKSAFAYKLIMEDISKGKGVCLIDPHGDLAGRIVEHIPKHRLKDLVYFNPSTEPNKLGISLFNNTNSNLIINNESMIENLILIFAKILSNDKLGNRIEYLLRNCLKTLLLVDKLSLSNIYYLLNDSDFRKKILQDLKDPQLRLFWNTEYNRAGDFQRVKMIQGVVSKLSRFIMSDIAKQIFEDNPSQIDFNKIINSQQILICNISKGLLGEELSSLVGSVITANIYSQALKRQGLDNQDRTNFYLYIDEFPNFELNIITQMLAETRKYKVILSLIEQSPSQQDSLATANILANIGNIAVFKLTNPTDQKLLIGYFKPKLSSLDFASLPPFNYYFKWQFKKSQNPISISFDNPYLE